MKATDTRPLGRTGLPVSQIGFGAAPLGNLYESFPDRQAYETVRAAWDAGIRLYDTAPLYGFGLSEHRIGEALRWERRADYVLSTKIGRLLHPADPATLDTGLFKGTLPFRPEYDYSYDGVMRSVEDSLQRLALERIDILLIHDVDHWTHGDPAVVDKHFADVMAGGYKAMVKLREEGVIKAIGAGVNEWEMCQRFAEAGDFDCFLLAGRYTLLEQEPLDSFLPLCERRGIGIILGGPYNTGILATGAVEGAYYNYAAASPEIMERVRGIEAVCRRHGVPLASAALQFPFGHPAMSSVIPGARTPAEVTRTIDTFAHDIPSDLWADLKAEGHLREDAPVPG